MIIKSKSRKRRTWRQLLEYMQAGTDERSIVLTHNVHGDDLDRWVDDFEFTERGRLATRKGSVVLYHEVMSFHDDDRDAIDRDTLEALAEGYINLRAEKGSVVAMSHHSEDHVHIHFCISGVEYGTGRSMRMSQSQFTAMKRSIQAEQERRFPNLSHSIADHGKKARQVRSDKEYLLKKRTKEPSNREVIEAVVRKALTSARSHEDLCRTLASAGAEVYMRSGRLQGVVAHGQKHRFSRLGIETKDLERLQAVPDRLKALEAVRNRREPDRELEPPSSRER